MIRLFRVLAVAEAFSWAALLTGMFLKWVIRTTELGVEIAGPVHGASLSPTERPHWLCGGCSAGLFGWLSLPDCPRCFRSRLFFSNAGPAGAAC
jgi:hypothetical protein